MLHLLLAFQKKNDTLIDNVEDLDIVIRTCNLLNTAKTIEKQQEVCGIITETNQTAV